MIGVPGADSPDGSTKDVGAVVLYERNAGGVWDELLILRAADAARWDHFGESVAIDESVIVVGAPSNTPSGNNAGSAYIFERNQGGSNAWGLVVNLTNMVPDRCSRSCRV